MPRKDPRPEYGSPGRGAPLRVDPRSNTAAEARLTIRLTAEQLDLLKARAGASRLTAAEYARLLLVEQKSAVLLRLEDRSRERFERAAARAGRTLSAYLEELLLRRTRAG